MVDNMQIKTIVTTEILNLNEAIDFVDHGDNGCANLFIGRVRNTNLGRPVNAVSYDAHKILCEKVFTEISNEAINNFENKLKIYISHFNGKLEIGGISVIIAVGSPHRDAAFKASRYIIEELKKRAPIWKKEHYVDGDEDWLLGHELMSEHDSK